MKSIVTKPTKPSKSYVRILSVLALTAIMGSITVSSAKADWDDHRGHGPEWSHRGWDDHARHNYRWRHAHPHYEPAYVYSPPVVYAPPPPEPTGINLILPLHFH